MDEEVLRVELIREQTERQEGGVMTNTGEILRACRRQKGLTCSQLARKANFHRPTLYQLESTRNCTVKTFETLLNAMGYEIEIMRIGSFENDDRY